jgi:hypothetical protein
VSKALASRILEVDELPVLQGFREERMQDGWHDLDVWRERQSSLLKEAEARRLARAARPALRERLRKYSDLMEGFADKILGLGRRGSPPYATYPPDEEVTPSATGVGLVEAIFEARAPTVRAGSVIELHRNGEEYVIREVDLGTGDHILYLSTEEPEWAAWIWERKTHG